MDERTLNNFHSQENTQNDNGTLSIGGVTGFPSKVPQPPGDISTWFLGTRAENGLQFKELIAKAVDHIYRELCKTLRAIENAGFLASFAIGNHEPASLRLTGWQIVFRRNYRNSSE